MDYQVQLLPTDLLLAHTAAVAVAVAALSKERASFATTGGGQAISNPAKSPYLLFLLRRFATELVGAAMDRLAAGQVEPKSRRGGRPIIQPARPEGGNMPGL